MYKLQMKNHFKPNRSKYKSRMGDTKRNQFKEEPVVEEEELFDLEKLPECQIFRLKPHEKNFKRQGFLANFHEVLIQDEEESTISALMLSVLDSSGEWFTCYVKCEPYFYLKVRPGSEVEMMNLLDRKYEEFISKIIIVQKQDLDLMNHLSGIQSTYLKIFFKTTKNHWKVRRELQRIVRRNRFQKTNKSFLSGRGIGQLNNFNNEQNSGKAKNYGLSDHKMMKQIEDIREHDINYVVRVAIDKQLRCGKWYNIICKNGFVMSIENEPTLLETPELGILAFDIETTKQPLKFPDSEIDEIMLISYVVDGEACLIVNRETISKDIKEFNYAPYKDIDYDIVIYNEPDEKATIEKFFEEIRKSRPMVLTTFNGDNFDWPFIEDRAGFHRINMKESIGIERYSNDKRVLLSKKFLGEVIFTHLDCYHWVKRDAYLPQGSHGLKKVTKAKLGYNPIEVDPELMVPLARSDPQRLCEYSVSDAVATYHLYKKHIHDFILALCSIVPLNPEMVLRHGSGVLCENLLMAQAYQENIIFPSKKNNKKMKFYKNHPIDTETYIGGFVQCINEGVYRSDIETNFKLSADHYAKLINECQEVFDFFITHESNFEIEDIENYDEILEDMKSKLWDLQKIAQNNEDKKMLPLIYHVDVAAMYPNIILTNRLQPTAIVNDKICCNCIFNKKENDCKRKMGWEYKVTYFPISKKEYEVIEEEKYQVHYKERKQEIEKAVKMFANKNYKRVRETKIEKREDTICMRENSFYVDTIRDFRDRR
jgi:DNA polymerase epsilon subunit 1